MSLREETEKKICDINREIEESINQTLKNIQKLQESIKIEAKTDSNNPYSRFLLKKIDKSRRLKKIETRKQKRVKQFVNKHPKK